MTPPEDLYARARPAPELTGIPVLCFNVTGELEGAVLLTIAWRGVAG
jgi:hypothetical protein